MLVGTMTAMEMGTDKVCGLNWHTYIFYTYKMLCVIK